MSIFSRELEKTLHRMIQEANERKHEYATLEHLLYALTYDEYALEIFNACNVNIEKLRASTLNYINTELKSLEWDGIDAKPTAIVQRVIQRAVIYCQASGKAEVNSGNILTALFSERQSWAISFLQEQDLTKYDVVNYISHGIKTRKDAPMTINTDKILKSLQENPEDWDNTYIVSDWLICKDITLNLAFKDVQVFIQKPGKETLVISLRNDKNKEEIKRLALQILEKNNPKIKENEAQDIIDETFKEK
jgi:hypothetical protein